MPYLHAHLLEPRFTLIERDQKLVRHTWFDGYLTQSELDIADPEGTVHLHQVVVSFLNEPESSIKGGLSYSLSWRDPDEGILHSGTCELKVAASPELYDFLDSFHVRNMELHMVVVLEAQHPAVHMVGDDIAWYPDHQNPLPARLHSIGYVPPGKTPSAPSAALYLPNERP